MPKFSYDFSISGGTPEEVEQRVQVVLTERLAHPSGGAQSSLHRAMRLSRRTASSLSYRPKLRVWMPLSISIWLGRLLRREKIDLTFTGDTAEGDGTHVAVSGSVGQGGQALADREFWQGVLNASRP
jgi:hypothetical protein